MPLYIQDPSDLQAPFLHERILEVCQDATCGGGVFAFVTREGVDLLIRDKVFRAFATKGKFDLIVGVDDVTNVRALTALQRAADEMPGLAVRVFYHTLSTAIFHPKFCWFKHGSRAFLVAGSGNLTARGLRGNWEAFIVDELLAGPARELETQWVQWLNLHDAQLRPLDDAEVMARAALNIRLPRPPGVLPPPTEEGEETEAGPVELAPTSAISHKVLIAEIPKGDVRWQQANFDLDSFQNFFGAQPGASHRIVLQHVDSSGALGALESRPSVAVKSRNFRFELEAAHGLDYPTTGRPIGVFVQIAPRFFRYRLLMPNDPNYAAVSAVLETMYKGRADRMRRAATTTDVLRQAWPDSPLWRTPLEVQD
jgi:hypothetical protein